MSFSFRRHSPNRVSSALLTDNFEVSTPGCSVRVSAGTVMPSNLLKTKLLNVHLNPNLLSSSGSIHINKNKFNINKNFPVSSSNLLTKGILNVSEKQIHYNPKFFQKSQPELTYEQKSGLDSFNKSRTIYVNPSFSKINKDNELIPGNLQKSSYDSNPPECYAFFETIDKINKVSDKRLVIPNCTNQQVFNSYTNKQVEESFVPINCGDTLAQPNVETVSSYNSKYCKVNIKIPARTRNNVTSKYKIRRNCLVESSTSLSPTKFRNAGITNRKPRLSGSFKKIGKRKLVRKSLIQSYIQSRRQSVPVMIQHSRNSFASRKKISPFKSKYKYVHDNLPKTSRVSMKYKFKTTKLPTKSQLKWRRIDPKSQDFVEIDKRKIIRKSVLQSLIEARRSKFYSHRFLNKKQPGPNQKNIVNGKTLRSRFKMVRNATASQLSQHVNSLKRQTSFTSSKKKDSYFVNQFQTSKSVLFRMPPSLRMKIRMEERQRKQMLLKKVNNRKKCLFYNRFGSCKGLENGSCKKLHDPKSIAICRKFLKGLCDGTNCKLSHEVLLEKMPVCHQFLAGVCIRPSCPFLHVKLSQTQPICSDFLQGFCQHGDSCTKRHQFICPEWSENRTCKNDKCPYPHPVSNLSKDNPKPIEGFVNLPSENIQQRPQTALDKNGSDEINVRYFTENNSKYSELVKHAKRLKVERKPDVRDGVTSVYNNESLLSYIPFS